jgi:hypothetical protein
MFPGRQPAFGVDGVDFIAVRTLMGHTFSGDISARYRERVSDDRLRKVTEHIRFWLFGVRDGGKGAKPVKEKPRLRIVRRRDHVGDVPASQDGMGRPVSFSPLPALRERDRG